MMNGNGDAPDNFFEGVEKLMEIWFTQSSDSVRQGDARMISRLQWEEILDSVNCKILDVIDCGEQTAYLLSESSLFVSRRRVILKTCGTTLCLQALPLIMKLAKSVCGLDMIADFFYSRKNFMKPDRQPHIHKTFQKEIEFLDSQLNGTSAAYCLGRLNGDCWFLYTLDKTVSNIIGVQEPDQTLEILMVDLDPEAMRKFTMRDEFGIAKNPSTFAKEIGFTDLIPGSQISVEFFDPCGYSLNGLFDKSCYWTIHVTPEPEFSYVSFETNLPKKSYSDLVNRVMKIFKPGRFTMTLFVNREGKLVEMAESDSLKFFAQQSYVDQSVWDGKGGPVINGYMCQDKQVAQLQDYCLYYTNYKIKPG